MLIEGEARHHNKAALQLNQRVRAHDNVVTRSEGGAFPHVAAHVKENLQRSPQRRRFASANASLGRHSAPLWAHSAGWRRYCGRRGTQRPAQPRYQLNASSGVGDRFKTFNKACNMSLTWRKRQAIPVVHIAHMTHYKHIKTHIHKPRITN
jgi:hypothetical protein